jgi:hypothetical protein
MKGMAAEEQKYHIQDCRVGSTGTEDIILVPGS